MKKAGVFLTLLIAGVFSTSGDLTGTGLDYSKYFRTDSALVYNWNNVDSTWLPASVLLFYYENNNISTLLTIDYLTRAEQAKTLYQYNTNNKLETETNYYFSNGWLASTRNLYTYDSQDRVSQIEIQKYANLAWATDRIQNNYVYDDSNRQLEFQSIYWRLNNWTDPKTDYSYYDEEGKLIRREAFYFNGTVDYRIIYSYDVLDLLNEAYAQYPSTTGWANWWLANYMYNPCGRKLSQIQYTGTSTGWNPGTKTVFFSHFELDLFPERKVAVCHKNRTIYVHRNEVYLHVAHGDCIGPCKADKGHTEDPGKPCRTPLADLPVKVYPNPATSQISIQKTLGTFDISSVELYDMNGNLLRSVSAPDEGEIVIYRKNLKSGNYFLKISGDVVYTIPVIFK